MRLSFSRKMSNIIVRCKNRRHIENSYTCMQAWNQPAFMLDGFLIRLDELPIFVLDGINTRHLIRLDGLSILKHKNGQYYCTIYFRSMFKPAVLSNIRISNHLRREMI